MDDASSSLATGALFCDCWTHGGWKTGDGWVFDRTINLWVHNRCRKPSKMYLINENHEYIEAEKQPVEVVRQWYKSKVKKVKTVEWGETIDGDDWSWE